MLWRQTTHQEEVGRRTASAAAAAVGMQRKFDTS
jgi:hypothetical protein